MPGLVCVRLGSDGTRAVGEDVQVALMNSEVENGDVVVDRGNHIDLPITWSGELRRGRAKRAEQEGSLEKIKKGKRRGGGKQ